MKNFLNNFAIKFQRFMVGRYGMDELYKGLLIFYLIAVLVSACLARATRVGYYIFWAIATAIIIFSFYRVFSKKIDKRRKENAQWIKMINPIKKWFDFQKKKYQFRKTHIFKKCPSCKSVLRLKKAKGKHKVVCPHCKSEFTIKVH